MKHPRLARIAAVSILLAAGAAQAAGPNLVKNGKFSHVTDLTVPANGYVVVDAGSDAINHWDVSEVSVDVVHGAYNAIHGNSIDMIGTPGPGEISQKIHGLQADTSYTLTFDLARNPNASVADVTVDFLGQSHTFSAPSNNSYTVETWVISSGNLSGNTSKLKFLSVNDGDSYSGAIIDNVSLTAAVPEPVTYAMLLAGLGLLGWIGRRKAG
jgi:choice-of-anchor C domain-containing protein